MLCSTGFSCLQRTCSRAFGDFSVLLHDSCWLCDRGVISVPAPIFCEGIGSVCSELEAHGCCSETTTGVCLMRWLELLTAPVTSAVCCSVALLLSRSTSHGCFPCLGFGTQSPSKPKTTPLAPRPLKALGLRTVQPAPSSVHGQLDLKASSRPQRLEVDLVAT